MSEEINFFVLGFDIGGTKIAACLTDNTGKIVDSRRIESGTSCQYEAAFSEMTETGDSMLRQAGIKESSLAAVGICAPGPMDMQAGILQKSPNMTWKDIPIRDDLYGHYKVPTILENDANAGMLAEWFFGAARGCSDAIYLTMSTGIGGGVISGGSLLTGATGIGTELGHVALQLEGPICGCGQRGCFEAFCGGRSVSKRMQETLADDPDHPIMLMPEVNGDFKKLNYQILRAAVREGIPTAREMWDEICIRSAQALGAFMMIFNPQMIIMGTLAHYSGEMFMEPVRKHLPKFAWSQMCQSCQLTTPALGPQIGELAAVAPAFHHFYKQGTWNPAQ